MKHIIHLVLFVATGAAAQESKLPYAEIPPYAEKYTAGTVASRLVDGLGFRFYWATEGLREEDLAFKAGKESRTTLETIEHIYQMSLMIRNGTNQTTNVTGQSLRLPFNEMRAKALENFRAASEILRTSKDEDLVKYALKFKRGEQLIEFPFWNLINGPISDCLWHVGQVVSLRRMSGNPISAKANVLTGTTAK